MLNCFKRNNRVHRCVGEWNYARVPHLVAQIWADVSRTRMLHGIRRNLYPHNATGGLCEESGAVALAGGDIEYVETAAKRAREEIAMKMLNLNLAPCLGGQPLAGPGQRLNRRHPLEDLAHCLFLIPADSNSCRATSGSSWGFGLWRQSQRQANGRLLKPYSTIYSRWSPTLDALIAAIIIFRNVGA